MSDARWKPNGVAFCWQPKPVLKRIREALDADNTVANGLLVYLALTEIASDKKARTFSTTHAYIAMRCGISQRTVQSRIKDLVSIGVIACEVSGLKAPAKYTLLLADVPPLPNDKQPLHSDKQPLPNDTQRQEKASLPTYKEYTEDNSITSLDCKNGGRESKNSPPDYSEKATEGTHPLDRQITNGNGETYRERNLRLGVPMFEPVARGLFRKEYKEMLEDLRDRHDRTESNSYLKSKDPEAYGLILGVYRARIVEVSAAMAGEIL